MGLLLCCGWEVRLHEIGNWNECEYDPFNWLYGVPQILLTLIIHPWPAATHSVKN